MPILGKYCKAYPLEKCRSFKGWKEKKELSAEISSEPGSIPGREQQALCPRYLYIHEDLVVTESIWINKDVVFDDVTPEWAAFCANQLQFAVPARTHANNESAAKASEEGATTKDELHDSISAG